MSTAVGETKSAKGVEVTITDAARLLSRRYGWCRDQCLIGKLQARIGSDGKTWITLASVRRLHEQLRQQAGLVNARRAATQARQ